MEVQLGPVVRRGRREVDRVTSTARETTDPHHTHGYEREAAEMEQKWK